MTFRRQGDELQSIRSTPGGFMWFRGMAPVAAQNQLSAHLNTRRRKVGWGIRGPGVAGLGVASARRLLALLLESPRRHRVADADGLELYVAIAAAATRLVYVWLPGGGGLGLMDPQQAGFAVLMRRQGRHRGMWERGISIYGQAERAESDLRALVAAWGRMRDQGRSLRLRVCFDHPPRGATWRLPKLDDAHIGIDLI